MDLSGQDIVDITGMTDSGSVKAWTRNQDVRPIGSRRGTRNLESLFAFKDVERAILGRLPVGFPVLDQRTGLRFSQALLVVRRYEFGEPKFKPWRCMVSPLSYDTLKGGFGGLPSANVFDRLGISLQPGKLRLNSHQIRHHLNTLAMKADVSQVDIAAWSGRRDVRQNAAYDHETDEEILQRQKRMSREVTNMEAARDGSPAVPVMAIKLPVFRSEIQARGVHGHATEFGFCRHDFASSPCTMFMDCLHCTEHACIKGHDRMHLDPV